MTNPPQDPTTLATPTRQVPGGSDSADAERLARENFARYFGTPAPPPVFAPPSLWSRVPVVFWVGLAIGALAFVVRASSQVVSSGPDGYSCSYTDVAGYFAAAVIVVLTVVGWANRASRRVADRLPVPLMSALTVLLLVLAFVHALRGNGSLMSPCDSMPRP